MQAYRMGARAVSQAIASRVVGESSPDPRKAAARKLRAKAVSNTVAGIREHYTLTTVGASCVASIKPDVVPEADERWGSGIAMEFTHEHHYARFLVTNWADMRASRFDWQAACFCQKAARQMAEQLREGLSGADRVATVRNRIRCEQARLQMVATTEYNTIVPRNQVSRRRRERDVEVVASTNVQEEHLYDPSPG